MLRQKKSVRERDVLRTVCFRDIDRHHQRRHERIERGDGGSKEQEYRSRTEVGGREGKGRAEQRREGRRGDIWRSSI
jgi:hypothetical protein